MHPSIHLSIYLSLWNMQDATYKIQHNISHNVFFSHMSFFFVMTLSIWYVIFMQQKSNNDVSWTRLIYFKLPPMWFVYRSPKDQMVTSPWPSIPKWLWGWTYFYESPIGINLHSDKYVEVLYTHVYIYMHFYIYLYLYIYICLHTYIHACIHTYIHNTYIYTQVHK